MEITFRDLKKISGYLERGEDLFFCDYLNQFEGVNIFEKFKNILTSWDFDVSNSIDLNLKGKGISVQLDYIISTIPEYMEDEISVKNQNLKCNFSIPSKFVPNDDILPIYEILSYIEINDVALDLRKVSEQEKTEVIDKFPANMFNLIIDEILKTKGSVLTFDNPVLEDLSINFLTNDPFFFLKGLFIPYGKDYFRDITFHLSRRIGSETIMDSTMKDIDFYIEKYSEEMENNKNDVDL